MSHRIKRFAAFAIFACFYHFAAVDSILGFYRHQTDTKTTTATTRLSLPDECPIWCLSPLSPTKKRTASPTVSLSECDATADRFFLSPDEIGSIWLRQALLPGSSKLASFSTSRRNADGLIDSDPQMSKMLLREGLVFPNSMRLIKARSYPALAARASWLIFCRNRCFRSS